MGPDGAELKGRPDHPVIGIDQRAGHKSGLPWRAEAHVEHLDQAAVLQLRGRRDAPQWKLRKTQEFPDRGRAAGGIERRTGVGFREQAGARRVELSG